MAGLAAFGHTVLSLDQAGDPPADLASVELAGWRRTQAINVQAA